MKKFYFLALAFILFFPAISHADIYFDPSPPQPQGSSVNVNCDNGMLQIYSTSGQWLGHMSCGGIYAPEYNLVGGVDFINCTHCGILDGTKESQVMGDSRFLSKATFYFTGPLDNAVNLFFSNNTINNAGNMLPLFFAIPVIFAIFASITRPFNT